MAFEDADPLAWHTATVDWGDGTTDDATVDENPADAPSGYSGTLTDSHAYSEAGTYDGTVTLSDDSGFSVSEQFSVTVLAATVTLTGFAPSSNGAALDVSYTVANCDAAPFNIGIYTSSDNATPGTLLCSYEVTGAGLDVGTHTAAITPVIAGAAANYYLLALADADPTPVAFDGGVFQATAAGQTTVYVFATGAADNVAVNAQSIQFDQQSYPLGSGVAAIEVHTAGAGDTVTKNENTIPVSIYGGAGSDAATNLAIDGFTVDATGDFSVTYSVTGQAALPFTIGIYGSPGGSSFTPTELLQTDPVNDPSLLAVGGPYTVTFAGDLGNLDTNCFLVADLDVYNDVRETTKADNVSAPLSGVFQTSDGTIYAFSAVGGAVAANGVLVSQDPTTGNVTVGVNGMNDTFASVSGVTIATPTGNNAIDGAGVTVPLTIYGGAGSDTIQGGAGGDTIYGGSSGGNTITGGAGGNTIYGGAGGGNTITGGTGNDTIYGQGSRSNTITDVYGNNTIYAGAGGDTITVGHFGNGSFAGTDNNQVFGGNGNDNITIGNGHEFVQAGSGNATIQGGDGWNWLCGGSGSDTIYAETASCNDIVAGSGENTIYDPLWGGIENASASTTLHSPEIMGIAGGTEGSTFFSPYDSRRCYYGEISTATCAAVTVSVTWDPNAPLPPGDNGGWTTEAWYTILDGDKVIWSQEVDQQKEPSGPVGVNGVRWQTLGNQTFTITGSDQQLTLVVSAWNPANLGDQGDGLPLQFSNTAFALVVPVSPTVTIQAVGQGGNSQVAGANANAYLGWQDSWQPIQVPVEGEGNRVELQLNAALNEVYANTNDWQASLEDAPGVDFWTSAIGGTAMTAAQFNATITAGNCSGAVYVSLDPSSGEGGGQPIAFDDQEYLNGVVWVDGWAQVSTEVAPQVVTAQLWKSGEDPAQLDRQNINMSSNNGHSGPFVTGAVRATRVAVGSLGRAKLDNVPLKLYNLKLNGVTPEKGLPDIKNNQYLSEYGHVYYYTDHLDNTFAAIAPFAVSFDYPANVPITINVWEQTQDFAAGNPQPASKWNHRADNESPNAAVQYDLGVENSSICWGESLAQQGGGAATNCLVLNDAPTIYGYLAGFQAMNVAEKGDMRISIAGPGIVSTTWQLTFTLERLVGQAPTFDVSIRKMEIYDPGQPK